ncbi:RDD family protein [Halalkalibacter akibai]|uniref:RDD domain-containing protein n=1 Tax=Halalkalibacter akibai (strain ATCC 43226 / DSM 21942 / CIP 109018 / JCM 9157 / 1139) TaxID=1236973 RepID=W4QQF2_HALA3|nr:RDD family protein [Halalkalibacter akibai]GAE34147.1 hypothetical protein JCM9157_1188 [Halalkalibacter akibai JCM 9157]
MNQLAEQRKRVVNNRLRHRLKPNRENILRQSQKSEEISPPIYQYAGFWVRLWAFLLDLITVFSIQLLFVNPIIRYMNLSGVSLGPFTVETIFGALIFFLYFAIMTKQYGQTVGKMVLGLTVISLSEQELTWNQIIFREAIGRFIHQAFFLLYAIYVMVAFTERKQGLHDYIADTIVVHELHK